jgi:hypothetical protein
LVERQLPKLNVEGSNPFARFESKPVGTTHLRPEPNTLLVAETERTSVLPNTEIVSIGLPCFQSRVS